MKCDVKIAIGDGNNEITIGRDESSKELNSLQDVIEYLYTHYPKAWLGKFFQTLKSARANIPHNQKYFLGKEIIGNCSLDQLIYAYPEIKEIFDNIKEKRAYSITLIDKAFINGEAFKGRVETATGKVTYVIRNKYDAELFAKSEHKKYLIEKTIKDNDINDEYLSNKYKSKLLKLKEHYKKNIKNITKEVDPNFNKDSKFTIKYLLLDYLNNYSKYDKIILDGDDVLDTKAIISDFFRELNHQIVYNEDSESDLAKSLRLKNYNRDSYGKKELYEILTLYFPDLSKKYSATLFIELNIKLMEELLSDLFKNDIILSKYHVNLVEYTPKSSITIPRNKIEELYKNKIKAINDIREKKGLLKLTEGLKFNKAFLSLKEILDFFSDSTIIVDDIEYPIQVKTKGNSYQFYYTAKKLSNEEKIKFKREGRILSEEFGGEQDTMKIWEIVDEDDIIKGSYNGYYIYKHTEADTKKDYYIISKSVIHPNLYDPKMFNSLKDAKLAVDGFNRASNIYKATDINININVLHADGFRYATINHLVNNNLTLDVIWYPLDKRISLPSLEYVLMKNKSMLEIKDKYKNEFNIDLSSLTLPNLIGTFLYAIVEKGYSINRLLNKPLNNEDYEKINKVIEDIKTAPIHQYLVERYTIKKSKENEEDTSKLSYIVYLKDLTAAKRVINSSGTDVKHNMPEQSLTASLMNLKKSLENTLFKDTGVTIEITTSDKLLELKDDLGNPVFTDVSNIRSFVHGSKIYINQSLANVNDMIHETFHILLAAIKVKDFDTYIKILESVKNKVPKSIKQKIDTVYESLAEEDLLEEYAVRYFARTVENGRALLYEDKTDEVVQYIVKQFNDISKSVRESIKKDFKTDLGIESVLNTLVKENQSEIVKNRIVTNIIEQGIKKGLINKDCK